MNEPQNLQGLATESWDCVDCGVNTAPAECGVAYRVFDALVAEVGLDRAGVVPLGGQLISAGMAQHVTMNRER